MYYITMNSVFELRFDEDKQRTMYNEPLTFASIVCTVLDSSSNDIRRCEEQSCCCSFFFRVRLERAVVVDEYRAITETGVTRTNCAQVRFYGTT